MADAMTEMRRSRRRSSNRRAPGVTALLLVVLCAAAAAGPALAWGGDRGDEPWSSTAWLEGYQTAAMDIGAGTAGPLPPLHLTRMSAEAELEPVAFQLKVGEVSKPIKTRWGWYVLRLIEKNEERTRPYNEVRDEIRAQLTTRRGYTEERRILVELRKKAEVVEKLPF